MSTPTLMTAFVVWTNTDLTEGKGWEVPLAVCETEATAERVAGGQYVQGSDCPVRKVELQLVNGEWYGPVRIVPPTDVDKRRQKLLDAFAAARAKAVRAGLTEEDIKALGLS